MITVVENLNSFLNLNNVNLSNDIQGLIKETANLNSVFCSNYDRTHLIEHENIYEYGELEQLATLLLHYKPCNILELGNHIGVASFFITNILPDSHLYSIEHCNYIDKNTMGYYMDFTKRDNFTQLAISKTRNIKDEFADIEFDLILINIKQEHLSIINDYTLNALNFYKEGSVVLWSGCSERDEMGREYLRCFDRINCVTENSTVLVTRNKEGFQIVSDNKADSIALWNHDIEDRIEAMQLFQ